MTHGLKVAGGDRLGKTIVFAKNHNHAQFIADRFDINYPHLKGSFARVIDNQIVQAQSLIDDFSQADKAPHIAVSVDMLDTGIDVPEVVNLVFFKIVRSKTKFWQMLGRGTRLSKDLFGPGRHKEYFQVFDFCQNLEFFNQSLPPSESAIGESLAKRLFCCRVDLIAELDDAAARAGGLAEAGTTYGPSSGPGSAAEPDPALQLRTDTVARLIEEVGAMSFDNFLVRPKRRYVEKYAKPEAWSKLRLDDRSELTEHLAGLPSGLADDDLAAKQFDLLILRTQLAALRHDPSLEGLRQTVVAIAGALEELANSIPMVAKEHPLLLEIQTDEYWTNVTAPMLETVRRRLRGLVKLIEPKKRPIVYTDFEDEIGAGAAVVVQGLGPGTDMGRFRQKARHFLKDHENHIAVLKLKRNEPLTATDLAELEKMFIAAGASQDEIEQASLEGGLGLFVRSLIGLERDAAKQAFAQFIAGKTLSANQLEFLNLIIDHLTERGAMDPRLLYESPFTDIDPMGIGGLFSERDVEEVVSILGAVRKRAAA